MDDNETRAVERFAQWITSEFYVYRNMDAARSDYETDAETLVQVYQGYREMEEQIERKAVQP